jgi:hypothetical protein
MAAVTAPTDKAAEQAAAAAAAAELLAAQLAEVDKLTAVPAVREPAYRLADGAPRLPFGKQSLTLGTATKAGHAAYVLVNGTAQTGFPTAAVAIAIRDGLIARDTIKALWAAADSRK